MERSRYGHYKTGRVTRHQRSRVVPGSFENKNRYYRCWQCGFVYELSKVATGLEQDTRYQTEAIQYGFPTLSGDPLSAQIGWHSPFQMGRMMELGPDGSTPKTIVATRLHNAGPGCPQCGTTNLP